MHLVDFVAGTGNESTGELLDEMRSIDRAGNGWVNIRPRPEDDPDPSMADLAPTPPPSPLEHLRPAPSRHHRGHVGARAARATRPRAGIGRARAPGRPVRRAPAARRRARGARALEGRHRPRPAGTGAHRGRRAATTTTPGPRTWPRSSTGWSRRPPSWPPTRSPGAGRPRSTPAEGRGQARWMPALSSRADSSSRASRRLSVYSRMNDGMSTRAPIPRPTSVAINVASDAAACCTVRVSSSM